MELNICQTNRCVNCSIRKKHLKFQPLREVTENVFNILKMWIFPTPLGREDIICKECFALLSEAAGAPKVEPENPSFGHKKVCFGCGVSILRARSNLLPPGSREKNVVLEKIPTHLAPHLERVCHPCWSKAVRFVRNQTKNDADDCKDCKLPSMDVDQQNETENIPLPEFPHQELHKTRKREPSIRSQLYKRVANSSRCCIFTGCKNKERLIIPTSLREMLLSRYQFYVPPTARICQYHLNNDHWNQLQPTICDFTGAEMDAMLTMLEGMKDRNIDFNHVNEMPPNLCQYWLGLDATKFHNLLNNVPKLHEIPKPSLALSIYLTKLKTKDTNARLSGLFNMPRSTLERYMNNARECLNVEFVTPYLDNIIKTENAQQEIQHIDMDVTDSLHQPYEIKFEETTQSANLV